jgi:spore maturation protein CgeB
MKVLLLVPKRYGFFHSFRETFAHLGAEVFPVDYYQAIKPWENSINTQIFRFPDRVRKKWESHYFEKINRHYLAEFERVKPDLVFVYNNEMLLPDTVQHFKKTAKLAFFLGDSPFYTPTNRYYLSLLFYADAIYTTDTFWIYQLKKMGMKNLHHLYPSIPSHQHFEKTLTPELKTELQADVLYIGMCYTDSWGYKKARFLNHFTGFDLQIHGNDDWKRWFRFFPDLEPHFRERQGYISVERMNDMYNASKIIPIDGNPGLLNALHWRLLEVLGSGALPLLEWQHDLAEIFPAGSELPAVQSYDEIREMTRWYLDNDSKRVEKVRWMKDTLNQKFSIENNAGLIEATLQLA